MRGIAEQAEKDSPSIKRIYRNLYLTRSNHCVGGLVGTSIPINSIGNIYNKYSAKQKQQKKLFKRKWVPAEELRPEDLLKNRPYYNYYPQPEDEILRTLLLEEKSVLIRGPPLSGKTRTIFEVLKSLGQSADVIIPRPEEIDYGNYPFPGNAGVNTEVVILDDLNRFVEISNFERLLEIIRDKKLIIVATCQSGDKFKLIDNKLESETIFGKNIIEMGQITENIARKIAKKEGIKWEDTEFNGTIGSIFLKLHEMRNRYNALNETEKNLLKIVKKLQISGVYEGNHIFPYEWVETIFSVKYPDVKLDWECILGSLKSSELVSLPEEKEIHVEEIYLEKIVELNNSQSEITILRNIFNVFSSDSYVMRKIGNRALSLSLSRLEKANYAGIAIKAYEKVLELKSLEVLSKESAQVHNDLGNAYCELALVGKKEADFLAAISSYNKALEVFTPDKLPMDHAIIQNNLGSAYCELALVKERSVDLLNNAIYAFEKALVIFKPDNLPMAYSGTKNNMGIAYQELALVDNKKVNLLNAINAYNEALKFRTADKIPVGYAAIQNNLGNAYAILSSIDNKQVNLLYAINAYNEALKFRTADKLPVDYAATQNNMGNAYLILASIENRKINLFNAINAYNEALKYRTSEMLPVYYAETQYSLGNAYHNLANIEERNKNHSNAIKAYENALSIYAPELHPMEFDIVSRNLMKLLT